MPSPKISHCDTPKCDAPIIFVVISNQVGRKPKLMPLDASPDPGGNVAVYCDQAGTWRGRVLGKGQQAASYERVYCPHFATCKDPAAHRRRQRDAVKAAQAAHNARLRNRRGRRPAPAFQPGMFRLPGDPT
jgi:hypothetical protein